MFICEIWLFDWYFPQFCKSDMSKYGYLEVFQRVPSNSRYRESTVYCFLNQGRIRQRKKRDRLRLLLIFPRYTGVLTPNAPTAIRLRKTFTFTSV